MPERRAEHARFCEQAHLLIERITKKRIHEFPKDLTKVICSLFISFFFCIICLTEFVIFLKVVCAYFKQVFYFALKTLGF